VSDSLREQLRLALQRAAMAPSRSQPLRLLDETAAAYADAALAAIEAAGWQVVPIEPTEEMFAAGIDVPYPANVDPGTRYRRQLKATLSAAPKP
jgi:hypothetical protein